MRAPDILADLPADQVDVAWSDFLARDVADYGVPNVYRVRPKGRGRWQCEWDDWTELGAWRSRWLGRCVRRAQRARRKAIGAALIERRYAR